METAVSYRSGDIDKVWDDVIFAHKFNALYEIKQDAVVLRHIIGKHEIGKLKIGDEFTVKGISIRDCLTIVDEYLYINADRRLNLLTGEIEQVCNPKHQKIAAKQTAFDYMPMSTPCAPDRCNIIAKIDRNDGKYLLNIVDIYLSYNDIIKWLDLSGANYTIIDEPYYTCDDSDDEENLNNIYEYDTERNKWRLVVAQSEIGIIKSFHEYSFAVYTEFHDFLAEQIAGDEPYYRLIVPCPEAGTIGIKHISIDEYPGELEIEMLRTYYFTKPDEYRDAVCYYYLHPDYIYSDDSDDDAIVHNKKNDKPHPCIPVMDIVKYIKLKNIEKVQSPLLLEVAEIKRNNVAAMIYKPDILKQAYGRLLYSGEHIYEYFITDDFFTIHKLNDPTVKYKHDISKIYAKRMLIYMRGDIIYTPLGNLNILTGDVKIEANPTIEQHQKMLVEKNRGGYFLGQYLGVYYTLYNAPVEIEGFRAVVNDNVSIYELIDGKFKIPTHTKPALREN